MKPGNIIIFPKWQKVLEEESIAAIKERRFDEGLLKLDELLSYQVKNHEIYTGKLICLMELERYDEAQELCESLLHKKDENYYHYVHIYITLLFQTNQYGLLMEIVTEELEGGNVPQSLLEPFNQLYKMSEKMRTDIEIDHSSMMLESLYDAINQDNHLEQWRLVNRLSKLNMYPSEKVISLLVDDHIHPVIKSVIFIWLKDKGFMSPVDIHKFGLKRSFIPAETPAVDDSVVASEIYKYIRDIDQNNPSLYEVIENLLKHYLYVLYPITPDNADVPYIAEALKFIGNEYLNIADDTTQYDKGVERYIQEIKTCDILYSSIIDT